MKKLVLSGCFALYQNVVVATRFTSISRGEVLKEITQPPLSSSIDPLFECAWRGLAFEFAQQLQPFRTKQSFQEIFDGLELSNCNQTISFPATQTAFSDTPVEHNRTTLFVDFNNGKDSNSGTQDAPLQHIAFAVVRARQLPQPTTLILRDGVHRLNETIHLDYLDSGLTIINFPSESPVISSGLVVVPKWQPVNVLQSDTPKTPSATRSALHSSSSDCEWTTYPSIDAMWADWPDPNVLNMSASSSYQACECACQKKSGPDFCYSWIYYSPAGNFGPAWDGNCFFRTDHVFTTNSQHDTFSGTCVLPPIPPNIFVAELTDPPIPSYLIDDQASVLTLFFSPDGGKSTQRAFRARFPNADLELDLFPKGWSGGGTRTAPPCDINSTTVIHVPLPENYGPGMFSDYFFGEGGPCERFQEGEWINGPTDISYWCQPNGRTAGCDYFVRSPDSISLDQTLLPHTPYQSDIVKNGAVLHYWRQGHWFSLMVRIDNTSYSANTTTLKWSYGAFQGAEGDAEGEDWYLDHVKEELDFPKEFFYEAQTQKLYYNHNDTKGTPPPSSWTWEVPLLSCLFNISGNRSFPAANITISGLTLTSASPSFMQPHGIPSGGDWGLSRMGAVFVSNAESVVIANNLFSRLDGNGVFLSGYTRNVTIDRNEFVWMGESGVATWGNTKGVDASLGLQPWFTKFTNNICHEIGMYEKQVSCYFAATSFSAVISNNIMFNMPRAAVNFNDDMGGGSKMMNNLIWNSCRESQDHGPFNSWGRVPYLRNWPNGSAGNGMKSEYDELAFNFIVAGGGANGGSFDHDDGSSFYLVHDNFEVYGGHKSDFDGHAKRSFNNLHAYANVYGSRCAGIMNLPHPASNDFFAEAYTNNKCILADTGAEYLNLGSPCSVDVTLRSRIILGNNSLYVPGSRAVVNCGKVYTFQDWISLGYDAGSTINELPSSGTIISWARTLLKMHE